MNCPFCNLPCSGTYYSVCINKSCFFLTVKTRFQFYNDGNDKFYNIIFPIENKKYININADNNVPKNKTIITLLYKLYPNQHVYNFNFFLPLNPNNIIPSAISNFHRYFKLNAFH